MDINELKKAQMRLYNDLAWLWPAWQEPEEYRPESELFASLIKKHSRIEARTLLDVGCGGGKNMFYLKQYFEVTGLDLSENMLKNARALNPECHFAKGDMRAFELQQTFDAIFINDSIAYMLTPDDLGKTFACTHRHLKTGGILITYPETFKGRFDQNQTQVWTTRRGNLDLTFIENNYDPDPLDNTFESIFVYLIRENGHLRIEHDYHLVGIFTEQVWLEILARLGFEIEKENFPGEPGQIYVCRKKPAVA